MHKLPRILIAGAISALVTSPLFAQTAEEKGLQIAIESDKRDSGWVNVSSEMEMILRNRAGKESKRKITNRNLEVDGDGDKFLSLFKQPRDVEGTAMLTFSHGLEPDDQWLFLPSIKRVKRISSKNKSGPFMGSEFAFEDLSSQEVDKYAYKLLKEEACAEFDCHVLQRIPQYKNSGYTKQIVWLDKAEYRPMKIEFYDRKDSLLKTLVYTGYQEYKTNNGSYWRPDQMEMSNHQTGKSTTLSWSNYDFETALSDKDFNQNALKRLQ